MYIFLCTVFPSIADSVLKWNNNQTVATVEYIIMRYEKCHKMEIKLVIYL